MENNEDIESDIKRELKWKELAIRIEHYKYYLTIALEVTAFFYVITGGVLGFYLKNPAESVKHPLEYVLLLPILMGAVFGGIFIYGARLQEKAILSMENIRSELRERLGLDIQELHDAHLLNILLRIFGYIYFIVGIALLLVPFKFAITSSANITPFSKLVIPKDLIAFSISAIAVLICGGALPIIARGFDNRLKKRRTAKSLLENQIGDWVKDIGAMKEDDIRVLKEHRSYPVWLPHLSKRTHKSIEDGTFRTEFLNEDIRKLKEECEKQIKKNRLWKWLTAA